MTGEITVKWVLDWLDQIEGIELLLDVLMLTAFEEC